MNIVFASQKGGSGKTTLCIHTAVFAASQGFDVAIWDTDPQGSALAWSNGRSTHPNVTKRQPTTTATVFIDTAPHAEAETASIIAVADLVIIPVRPSVLDVHAAMQTVSGVKRISRRSFAVINGALVRQKEIDDVRQLLIDAGIEVCPVVIYNRLSYSRSLEEGQGITEYDPEGIASHEIASLFSYIQEMAK